MTTTESERLTPLIYSDDLRSLEARISVPEGRDQISVVAPFTELTVGAVPEALPEDVAAAVDRARRAQESWRGVGVDHRVGILARFHDSLVDNRARMLDLLQLESGKSRIAAFEETFDTVATTRYYLNTGPGLLKPRRRAVSFPGFTTTWEYRRPFGVVGNIVPWNFPLTLAISDLVPALIAGNTAVIKPDLKTPYSALYALELLEAAGLPDDVVQVVTGQAELIGPTLINEVDMINFTGSTRVGRLVAEQAGRRLIPASLELGGKNAAIVLSDVDLEKAVRGLIRATFVNAGQICLGMERIYVPESLGESFIDQFVAGTRNQLMTAGYEYGGMIGSLVNRQHLENVEAQVNDAVARGATVLAGGQARPDVGPLFYEPTVLTDVDESMTLCRTETFGPVVSIYTYTTVDEAISLANDSDLGLNFSVWGSDVGSARRVAVQLEAGTVGINDGYASGWSSYDAPIGGMKGSGLSRRHGEEGLLKFTQSQVISIQRGIDSFAPLPGMTYETFEPLLGKLLKMIRRLPFYK